MCEQLATEMVDIHKYQDNTVLINDTNDQNNIPTKSISWITDMKNYLNIGECRQRLRNSKQRYFRL